MIFMFSANKSSLLKCTKNTLKITFAAKRFLQESNPQLVLRSKAPRTLLLVMFCLIKFLKSLDLRGFLAIVGTLLFVFVWSLSDPVSAYFVSKMLA